MKNYCQFRGCNEEATKKGVVFGKESYSDNSKLEEMVVYSCNKHSVHPSFFPDTEEERK